MVKYQCDKCRRTFNTEEACDVHKESCKKDKVEVVHKIDMASYITKKLWDMALKD